jgi:catechol 2,3-dioxygenase-like lactoylglutathione lyase family enzyme
VLSNELEHCLNAAFQRARKARHELLTIEHLLLAMLETPSVCEILRGCRCDVLKLKQELKEHLDQSAPRVDEGEARDVQPTPGLQRVLQRAVFHVQSSGRKEVGVAQVLIAIFSEKQSHAVSLLNSQNVARLDVVNYVSHEPRSSLRIGSIVIHTPEFDQTIAFWQAALGYVPRDGIKADWVVLRDPTGRSPSLAFQARDRRPRSRSWIHLDLYALDQEAEVQRLLTLGARRYPWRYPAGCDFVVLEDPGGNLFCVVAKPDGH